MILVTGCTGFVGSHLVNALADQRFDVKCLARHARHLDRLPVERVAFVGGDVTDLESLLEAVEGVLPNPPITSGELAMLLEGNVTEHNALTEIFGIEPTPFHEVLRLSL